MTAQNTRYSLDSLSKWDRQICLFAKYFLVHAKLPKFPFSLLDVGCGTGSALREIKKMYPSSILYGCDLDEQHLTLSNTMNRVYGTFFKSNIFEIKDSYEIIYVSNVLEHLHDWKSVVTHLLSHCIRIYALVPYKELLKGISLDLPEIDQHVSCFDDRSFYYFQSDTVRMDQRIIRTPYAWGHPLKREVGLRIKAALNGESFEVQRELLVAFTNVRKSSPLFGKPFYSRPRALINMLRIS